MALTDMAVRQAKPESKKYSLSDGRELISKSGQMDKNIG